MVTIDTRTLPALLSGAAKAFGTRPALFRVEGGACRRAYDYVGLESAARRLAAMLIDMGIRPGERVMILCENRPEWAVAYFGTALAGAVAVPVLVDFLAEQIANVASHADIKAACASDKTVQKLSAIGASIPIIRLDAMDESGVDTVEAGKPSRRSFGSRPANLPGDGLAESDLACILYTSGTSGNSKGVMLTHGNIVSNAIDTRAIFPLRPEDRVLSVMPLAHTLESTMGMVTPLLQGCSMYYLDRPPTAPVLAAALLSVRPSIMVIVPLIIEKLYRAKVEPKLREHPLYRFAPTRSLAIKAAGKKLEAAFGGAIRFLGIGGAALSRDVEEFLLSAGFPYAIGYGLTETSPLVAAAVPGKTRLGSTGRILDSVEVRIMAPSEAESAMAGLAGGEEGEIQVRGPNVMRGYYKDEERTAAVLSSDGWFRTGDLGALDADGLLYVKGRLKAMILGPSGENIYPEEIESTLAASGLVEESLVYAAKDGALVAMVVLNERAKALLADAGHAVRGAVMDAVRDASNAVVAESERLVSSLRQATNAKLASFSRLARIAIRDIPFEKTATMKIKRYLYPDAEATAQ